MFGATQMPFYGKNNYYSPQTMYFRLLGHPLLGCPLLGRPLLGRPLLGRRSSSRETRPSGGVSRHANPYDFGVILTISGPFQANYAYYEF